MKTRKLAIAPAAPAAPRSEREPKEQLACILGWRLESALRSVAEARAQLGREDFAYRLAWSEDAFRAAAEEAVSREMIGLLWDLSAEDFLAQIAEQTIRQASYRASSTSAASNLMEQEKLAAFARITRDLLSGWKLSVSKKSND